MKGRFCKMCVWPFVGILAVLAATSCSPALEIQDVTVGGLDYMFDLSETLQPGPTTIGFENRGEVAHELIVVRLRAGITLPEMISGLMEGKSPEEFSDGLVGILVAEPSERTMGRLFVELESGRSYALVCMFEDQEGDPPHLALGMVRSFSVE